MVNPNNMQPLSFLDWLETLLPEKKPSTRRQYIASAKWQLSKLYEGTFKYGGGLQNLEAAIIKIQSMQSRQYSPVKTDELQPKKINIRLNTSSQKARCVDKNELIFLNEKLLKNSKGWGFHVLVFMSANILVGLRPSEWRHTTLLEIDGKRFLVIKNGKNSNGRSHGELRHLDITNLNSEEFKWIEEQLLTMKYFVEDDYSWDIYQNGMRAALYRITRKYLSKRKRYPTLYCTRHQFVANAKAAGKSDIEIAAMCGHATDLTASIHYSKANKGSGNFSVEPDKLEMEKIRLVKPNISDVIKYLKRKYNSNRKNKI
jgi:integrase